MNINLKQTIEQGNLSKIEHLEKTLRQIQNLYLDELKKSKETLENIERILKLAPHLMKGDSTSNVEQASCTVDNTESSRPE